jgi:spermidine synthase
LNRQPSHPEIKLLETQQGEVTLSINDGQAMQGWERQLMEESADMLCGFGSDFLEVGLGLGLSALRIASYAKTRKHTVVEIYQTVIDLFKKEYPVLPPGLDILNADFFRLVHTLPESSLDGIFFDPALPESMWDDGPFWDEVIPAIIRTLRPGGAFIPFFSTIPVLRWQYLPFFSRIVVERRPFTAYDTTSYTSRTSGDAYIQCFVKAK